MSVLKQRGFKVDVALDNRILNWPKEYTIFKTGQNVSIQNIQATTYNASSVTFNILPPSQTWIDRRFRLRCKARVTLSNVSGVLPSGYTGILAPLPDGSLGTECLRPFPIQSQTTNVDLQVNNGSVTTTPNLYLLPLSYYGKNREYNDVWTSTCPSMLDTCQTYAQSYQTAQDPMGSFLNNSVQQPRGAAVFYTIISNTPTSAVVECSWEEPLVSISPLLFPEQSQTALWDINKINLTMNFASALQNIWCHDATNGANVDSVSFAWVDAPTIQIWQISNPGNLPEAQIEKILPYTEIDVYQDSGATLTSGSTYTQTLSNLRLDGTPSRIYLFCRKNINNSTFSDADAYALIENISVNFGSQNSLLNNLSSFDVYQLAVDNGYKYSWSTWNSVGSCVCIDFGKDISTDLLNAVGMSNQTQVQITIRYKNLAASSVTFTCYTIVLYEGIFDYTFNQSSTNTNVLTVDDLTHDKLLSAAKSRAAHIDVNYMGGSFRTSTSKFLKKAIDTGVKYGPKAYDLAKKYVPKARSAIKNTKDPVSDAIGIVSPRAASAYKTFADLVGKGVMSHNKAYDYMKSMGYTAKELQAAGIKRTKPRKAKLAAKGLSGGAKKAPAKRAVAKRKAPARRGRGLSGGYLIEEGSSDCEDLLSGRD
jgi:hypothetical protein